MRLYIKSFFFHLTEKLGIGKLSRETSFAKNLAIENYFQQHVLNNPKYSNPKKLNRFEYNVFSQSGGDGILEEIFKRIGTTNKFFVEFGVSNGLENMTASLLMQGWKGCWFEGSTSFFGQIEKSFSLLINERKLFVKNSFITAENIQALFKEKTIPQEFDLLSIDIDGNDYWVWKAITEYKPRVVVIECNPFWGPSISWVMKYNPTHVWDRTTYYGTSLKALEILGKEKGYILVGVSLMGNDAFFVRKDLVGEKFFAPYTSENHYESNKVFLFKPYPYKKTVGPFENIKNKQ